MKSSFSCEILVKFKLMELFVLIAIIPQLEALLFPADSNLGLVSSLSVPVVEYFPERRILIDWCFTMSYDLPWNVSTFYNVPIWPVKGRPKRELLPPIDMTGKEVHYYRKYDHKTDSNRHPSDFSAGELYQGIEDFLMGYGFHETCLLRSVCGLARHPFDDQHQNIITDIVTFLLTPSQHEGFDESESMYREAYEDAEMRGFLGQNCEHLYPDCSRDLLGMVTKIIFPNG